MPTLQFKGKTFVQNHHLMVKHHELVPVPEKSLTENVRLDDNLIIHGDNLLALKALLPMYAGKVKLIYIDPPYNTGKEHWVYNDNVNSPMIREWLGKVVDKEDLTRHDKWLCMMMPRLKLLRELLTDDGSIFVSCDDNEQAHLRMLMDEIFGGDNFVTTVIWQKVYSPKNSARHFSEDHDYIVVYAKNGDVWTPNSLSRSEKQNKRYKNPDNDPRGPWKHGDSSARNYYSKGTYAITCPGGRVIPGPPTGRYWVYSEDKLWELHADNRLWWGSDGNGIPAVKQFLAEVSEGVVPQTLWFYKDVGHTQDAKKELLSILNFDKSEDVFTTPKPTALIERILDIATETESIVLDSFAGSGTTGHAVLAKNAADGGDRKFIMVELEDYADSMTAERVRRVIRGGPAAKDGDLRAGLGGTFSFFELGHAIEPEGLLTGEFLPPYDELARYVFYTATGEEFQPEAVDEARSFIGTSKGYEVYLIYKPDIKTLKSLALNLEFAESLGKPQTEKRRLVFAPARYLDDKYMEQYRIEYAQLPYELYRTRV